MISLNGHIQDENIPIAEVKRLLAYGDGFFETFKVVNFVVPFWKEHCKRIELAFKTLGYEPEFSLLELYNDLIELCSKSNLESTRARITIFQKGSGSYKRDGNKIGYLIELSALTSKEFVFQDSPYVFEIYRENQKPPSPLSNIKTVNALLYTLASRYAELNSLDDVLLQNTNREIIEATSSNIFLVNSSKTVMMPPLDSGCVAGTMRAVMVKLLEKEGYAIDERNVMETDLHMADEIWFTNAIDGIRAGTKFRNKTYKTEQAQAMQVVLNQYFMKKIEV